MIAAKEYLVRGRGRIKPGDMNATERRYAALLEERHLAGDILWYRFEGLTLRLASRATYTPDFVVMRSDGAIELHEVKGYWLDTARVKIRVAASLFPFRFLAAKPRRKSAGGGFDYEEFG